MKLEELYEGLLEEGISPVVYHVTSLYNAGQIMESNVFQLAPTFTKTAELELGSNKMFYLSTARTRTSHYFKQSTGSVLFKLNGRKLSNTMSGSPVDYWGENSRKSLGGDYEQEDRIFSDKNEIKNAMSYIDAVDIVLPYRPDKRSIGRMLSLIQRCKRSNIPVRVFPDSKSLIQQSQQVNINELIEKFKSDDKRTDYGSSYKRRVDAGRYRDGVLGVFFALKFDPSDNLGTNEQKQIKSLVDAIRYREQSSISSDFHNAQHSPQYRNILLEVSKLLRQHKFRSWQDALPFIEQKWVGKI